MHWEQCPINKRGKVATGPLGPANKHGVRKPLWTARVRPSGAGWRAKAEWMEGALRREHDLWHATEAEAKAACAEALKGVL